MNRTQIIGITTFVIGLATVFRYQRDNYNEVMMSLGGNLIFYRDICRLEWLGIQSK